MARLDDRLISYLENLRRRDAFRTLVPGRPDGVRHLWRNTKRLVNFSSNDYLSLSKHPALIERANQWTREWGAGCGASRLITGNLETHQAVENKLASLKGTEAALIFNSGYQANSAIPPVLFDREMLGTEALVFTDKLIHASLHHGLKSAGVRNIRFRHNDLGHLEVLLKKNQGKPAERFIITESVFSMDGDRADLEGLASLAEKHGAFLYVDEAHATGVLGPGGMGLAGKVEGGIDLVMGTFSKASAFVGRR